MAGDRFYGDDKSVISGFAKFEQTSVLVIGQEKGEDLDTRIQRNFGMMRPEGYRKTIRLMKLADKFNIPIRYIGVGEGIDDLRTFNSNDFIDALFSQDEDDV